MRKWSGILFAIFMVFLFLEILIGFPISLESDTEQVSEPVVDEFVPNNKLQTQQKMQGVHLVESNKGSRDWELFSQSAENTKGKGAWQLQQVKVMFYNNEIVDFVVTGDKGNIDAGSKNLRIEGNVVTKSSNGYEFRSNSIIYYQGLRLIESPDEVTMIGPPDDKGKGLQLRGKKLEARVEENLMKIQENVKATKQLGGGKQFQITSRSAEFSGKNRTARFIDDVSIDVGSLKMEGPEANFEYRPGVDMLQSVLVKGGVKVSDIDKYATSDSVKFDPEQNKFVFNGRPRVVQNNDEITGEQIVFIDGGKKVRVEKLKSKTEKK